MSLLHLRYRWVWAGFYRTVSLDRVSWKFTETKDPINCLVHSMQEQKELQVRVQTIHWDHLCFFARMPNYPKYPETSYIVHPEILIDLKCKSVIGWTDHVKIIIILFIKQMRLIFARTRPFLPVWSLHACHSPRSSEIICDTRTVAANPRTKTKTLGPRGFYFASSAAWNALPVHLRDP